jgi:(2Fe-2S) ferredoxin
MNPIEKIREMRETAKKKIIEEKQKFRVRIYCGDATCENAAGAKAVYNELLSIKKDQQLNDVYIGLTGCAGRCDKEPLVQVITDAHIPTLYTEMTPEKIRKVVEKHIIGKTVVKEWTL